MGAPSTSGRTNVSLLLVDGYNVIAAAEPYRSLASDDLDAARAALVNDVAGVCVDSCEAYVVFDGAANENSDGTPHVVAGVTVVFSAFGHDADETIERIVMSRRVVGDEIVLVTSDAQTQWVGLGPAVRRMSAREFIDEINASRAHTQEHSSAGSSQATLADRVDVATRQTLAAWARGRGNDS